MDGTSSCKGINPDHAQDLTLLVYLEKERLFPRYLAAWVDSGRNILQPALSQVVHRLGALLGLHSKKGWHHEGNTEEENNGYVVFELSTTGQLKTGWGRGGEALYRPPPPLSMVGFCAGILEQSIEARNWVGIGLSYRPTRLHRLAE